MSKSNRVLGRKIILTLLLLIVLLVSFCSCRQKAKQTELIIYAAASLTESFTELGQEYEKLHDIKIIFNFAGSQSLATSIRNGFPCDIYASANLKYMEELKSEKLIKEYEIFAGNELIACKSSYTDKEISSLLDLADSSIRLITGDKEVPVGKYFFNLLNKLELEKKLTEAQKQAIIANIKSQEINVKDIVTKLVTGEGDYGIIYRTDVTPKNKEQLAPINIEELNESSIDYPIGVSTKSEHIEEAQKFIEYVMSDKGKSILKKYNFSSR